jgi:ABC-type hemin transport system substrate-binding protein
MLRSATILAVLLSALTAQAEPARIVTAGSAVTEIAAALGLAPRIVAVDTSGKEVDGMGDKPDVGYVRMLGAEGILSQKPDLFLVSGEAGPSPVLEQIRAAGVDVVVVPNGHSLDNIDDTIRAVATATGRTEVINSSHASKPICEPSARRPPAVTANDPASSFFSPVTGALSWPPAATLQRMP